MDLPNTQKIQKQHLRVDGVLKIKKIFFTIQGEAIYSGRPSVFVRLSGCNLMCPFCDTDYTGGEDLSPIRILAAIREETCEVSYKPLIVLSGGEPFRQNIYPLVQLLTKVGYTVQIETNGTLALPLFDYGLVDIVCSPKAGKINKKIAPHVKAFKYVVKAGEQDIDGLPLTCVGHAAKPTTAKPANSTAIVYVQPLDEQDEEKNKANLDACVETVYRHGYTLCLQTHKILGVE